MYQLNTKNSFFIWFSKDENLFLNPENQSRLVRIRAKNPSLEITFIYSAKLLSAEASRDMMVFCAKHQIQAVDFEKAYEKNFSDFSDTEKKLMDIAKNELALWKAGRGGNAAACSDIVRILKPIIKNYGFYFQTAYRLDLEEQPKYIEVITPLIVFVEAIAGSSNVCLNNNFIAMATDSDSGEITREARFVLDRLQARIVKHYSEPLNRAPYFEDEPRSALDKLFELFLSQLSAIQPQCSLFDLRMAIEELNAEFLFNAFCSQGHHRVLSALLLEEWRTKLNHLPATDELSDALKKFLKINYEPTVLTLQQYQQLHGLFLLSHKDRGVEFAKARQSGDKIEAILERISQLEIERLQFDFYRRTVMNITGPEIYAEQLRLLSADLEAFGLRDNNLDAMIQCPINKQNIEGEVSWTPIGVEKLKEREATMEKAASTIAKAYRRYRLMKAETPVSASSKGEELSLVKPN